MDLKDIQKAADERYAPFPVKISERVTVLLRAPVKLGDKDRARVNQLLKIQDEEEGVDAMREVIRIAATTPQRADLLLKALGDDPSYLLETIQQWAEHTRAGEASPSVS